MKKIKTVFDFTLKNQILSKGYKGLTVVLAVLLLLLPAVIMPIVELLSGKGPSESGSERPTDEVNTAVVTDVFCYTEGIPETMDFSVLESAKLPGYENANIKIVDSYEKAAEEAGKNNKSLILGIVCEDGNYEIKGVLPENSTLIRDDARLLAMTMNASFTRYKAIAMGITEEQFEVISKPVVVAGFDTEEDKPQKSDAELARDSVLEILSYVLLYVNIMLIYFLVLFYGMSTANSVVMEKSSKLMDTMLVSVSTDSMIWGKLLATFTAAVMQFLIWVISAVLGFAIGTGLVFAINPKSTMSLAVAIRAAGELPPLFGAGQIILAVLIILAGFMMYCAIAAVCGSMASKEEELSSSMSLFSMILVISFLGVFYASGFLSGSIAEGMQWYDIVPFTSILVTPARLMLDKVSLPWGALTFAVVLVFTVVLVWLAGRVYKLLAMYKGNPPKIGQVLKMLKQDSIK